MFEGKAVIITLTDGWLISAKNDDVCDCDACGVKNDERGRGYERNDVGMSDEKGEKAGVDYTDGWMKKG